MEKIERMEEVDLCYTTNLLKPYIMSEATIYGDLEQYNLYLSSKEIQGIESDQEEDELERFETRAQIKEFVNAVFQPIDKNNLSDNRFIKKTLSTERIFKIVNNYTDDFKTSNSFSTWCSAAGLDFLVVECIRKNLKYDSGQKKRNRCLHVLQSEHHGKKKKKKRLILKVIIKILLLKLLMNN
ncbi:hypothetical protein BD770DRAFT_223290 [Pilaira anomala]|nr:hypothetical protein BD770DRAFT_223290 [Pilaira anomala]